MQETLPGELRYNYFAVANLKYTGSILSLAYG